MLGAIVNPTAGGWARLRDAQAVREPAAAVARWLAPEAPECVRVWETRQAGEGARCAREAQALGCHTVVAVGGDGTIHDVLQGMAGVGRMRLGVIPMGTANVLARELDLPLGDPAGAARLVREGGERRIDLGWAGERWFALVAGIGFDGAVIRAVNGRWKRRLGALAYLPAILRQALVFPGRRIVLALDDGPPQEFDAYLVLVANGGRYGGRYRLGADVSLSDGLLDVFLCQRRWPLIRGVVSDALALAQDRFATAPGVCHFQARRITLDAESPFPLELDGDLVGETPVTIEVVPGALTVVIPLPQQSQ